VATLAILNPVAGRRAAAGTWRRIRAEVPATRDWECVPTERRGHATVLAREAASLLNRYERVVAIGGDGTVGEIASGLASSDTPLAVVPAGTGNDLARNLLIPFDPVAAARLATTAAARRIDLGEVRTPLARRHFVNIAGVGFDAEVAWRVNRLPRVLGGTLPYVAGVLQTLWRYAAAGLRITIDGESIERPTFLVAVGNCASYAGGMRIVPEARPDDGRLDVCLVRDLSRLEVLRLVPRLYSGGHVSHPAVEMFRCRTLVAEAVPRATDAASDRVLCHADGEHVGGLPVRFAIRPGALWCVTGPARASTS
jgi:diacylglycerol kinase (ATP)